MRMRWLVELLLLLSLHSVFAVEKIVHKNEKFSPPLNTNFDGCPYDNDFYYDGIINSPYWPNKYPPNDKCYYYITAAPGHVVGLNFTSFDLETCCDYVTIYDGPSSSSRVLARIGGPNMTSPTPTGMYLTSTRNALVTFTSDAQIEQTGFQMQFSSEFSASPCNRDVLLVINAMSDVGSQANYVTELNFLANNLTRTWNVGPKAVNVIVNLQVDDSYAVIYQGYKDNDDLSKGILSFTQDVDNVLENNVTSLNCLFRYADQDVTFDKKDLKVRQGIEQVALIFVAQNANDDQDYYQAMEYAHIMRTTMNYKAIVVGMGPYLNMTLLSALAYSPSYAFQADWNNLSSLTDSINRAMCEDHIDGCGP